MKLIYLACPYFSKDKNLMYIRYGIVTKFAANNLTKDRFINTKLSILEADLQELNSGEAISFYDMKYHLERHMGRKIDPKIETVIEWHTALKNMTNG